MISAGNTRPLGVDDLLDGDLLGDTAGLVTGCRPVLVRVTVGIADVKQAGGRVRLQEPAQIKVHLAVAAADVQGCEAAVAIVAPFSAAHHGRARVHVLAPVGILESQPVLVQGTGAVPVTGVDAPAVHDFVDQGIQGGVEVRFQGVQLVAGKGRHVDVSLEPVRAKQRGVVEQVLANTFNVVLD